MNVRVYVEGGGDSSEMKAKCRRGFSYFFRKTDLAGQMPRIISCGSRQKTYDKFCTAVTQAEEDTFIVLLVDSEAPVTGRPWLHLRDRDGWRTPSNATDNNAHLMVQCMEAWFLADKNTLAGYFGQGFNGNALPGQSKIELILKIDVNESLKRATRHSTPKGAYHKGHHSFDILSTLNPQKVIDACPHAKRLVRTLLNAASRQ